MPVKSNTLAQAAPRPRGSENHLAGVIAAASSRRRLGREFHFAPGTGDSRPQPRRFTGHDGSLQGKGLAGARQLLRVGRFQMKALEAAARGRVGRGVKRVEAPLDEERKQTAAVVTQTE